MGLAMNWKNSDFQIFYHIVGNCHTGVEALRVLHELKQDRSFAIKSSLAEAKRSEAKVLAARRILGDEKESTSQKMRSLCDVEEQDARMEIAQPCYTAALHELSFIEYLIDKLGKITGLGSQPSPLEFQKIQPIENAYDIVLRAHTSIALYGSPSAEIINESRNSPYRVHVIEAVHQLMAEFSVLSRGDASKRIDFISKSKVNVLADSGIVKSVGYPTLDVNAIEFPQLEELQCQNFKQKALVSPSTNKTT